MPSNMPGTDLLYGMLLPIGYVIVLLGSLITFSSLSRKRKANQSATLLPWFPPHLQRNIYLSLLHLEPSSNGTPANTATSSSKDEKKAPAVPEGIIRAALLRRAVEDIHRIVKIRSAKGACTALLAQGRIGDDLMLRFQRAEHEMEDELKDVVMEANALAPNWGQTIFQSANEIAGNALFRQRLAEIHGKTAEEKEWWEKRRTGIQEDFMRELDGDTMTTTPSRAGLKAGGSDDDGVVVLPPSMDGVADAMATGGANDKGSVKKRKGKK